MSSPFMVRVAASGLRLQATVESAGEDLVIVVTGGDRPHVGVVAVATPHPSSADPAQVSATVSRIALPPHREGSLAERIADRVCRHTGAVVAVTAGIHVEHIQPSQIATVERLADRLAARVCARLEAQASRSRR